MKKLLLAFCSLALIAPLTYAQEGPGDGDGSGEGVRNQYRGDLSGIELPDNLTGVKDDLDALRAQLAADREAYVNGLKADGASDEDIRTALATWKETNSEAIAELQGYVEHIRTWIRENRPEPDGTAVRKSRQNRLRANKKEMTQVRAQYESGELNKEEFKQQVGELLRERKRIMRNQRAGEGGVGGDNGRRPEG